MLRRNDARRAAIFLATLGVVCAACSPPEPPPEPDAGEPLPDACNSADEALNDPSCELTLGQMRQDWISFAGDQDWFSFRVPATADARTLLHVTGGYPVPNTAVNLSLNLLREDGQQSLARRSDRHGQAAPRPVDLILPFSEANARLLVLVSDDPVNPSRPQFDLRAQYTLKAEVVQDPDVNEPNDTTATAVTLTPQNGALVGTQSGYLSTTNDVDRFSLEMPAGKKVLHLAVKAPELAPPPPFRLSYVLLDPAGKPIAEAVTPNAFLAPDLAAARLSRGAGTYTVVVKGYVEATGTEPVPGDLRLQYTVEARIFDETDPSEGPSQNDTIATARAMAFGAVGQTQTVTGRLGYVPDVDWFEVQIPANLDPTVLHYRLVPGTGPARFSPLPGAQDRELRLVRRIQTGGTAQDDVQACRTDKQVCPTSFGNDPFLSGLHSELCQNASPPQCLWSLRTEHPEFEALRNFEGALPVPPHSESVSLFFAVMDQQNDYADDTDYTLSVTWRSDADEASRYSGGAEQNRVSVLAEDSAAATFPAPPQGAAYELSGRLSYGYGFFRENDPNRGDGIRAPADYDAVTSDRDRFELSLPVLDPLAGPLDRTWELQWEVGHLPDGGVPPYELAVELEFCDGDAMPQSCTPVKTAANGAPMVLSYSGADRNAWHNPGAPASERQPIYDRDVNLQRTQTTVRAYGCFCFEPRFIRGGKFFLNVLALDREHYADVPYTIRTAYTSYPQSYPTAAGSQSCPPPTADAGCAFTRQP